MNPSIRHLFLNLLSELSPDQCRRLRTAIEEIQKGNGPARTNAGALVTCLDKRLSSLPPSQPDGPSSADSASGHSLLSSDSPLSGDHTPDSTPSMPVRQPSSNDEDDDS